ALAGGWGLSLRLLWRDAPPACAPRGRPGAAGRATPWGRRRASCVRPGSPVRSVSVLLDRHLVVAQQVVRGVLPGEPLRLGTGGGADTSAQIGVAEPGERRVQARLVPGVADQPVRSAEHTSELQARFDTVC